MILRAENLSFGYGAKPLFRAVSAELKPGAPQWFAGPNGAGKSTFLKLLSGYLPAAAGRICLDGRDLRSYSGDRRARHLGVIPQSPVPALDFTVREMVTIICSSRLPRWGAVPAAARRRLDEALERFELGALAAQPVNRLSGGERARTALAGAYALAPDILLMDEPTAALDPYFRNLTADWLEEYAQTHAVLVVTHDFELLGRARGTLWLLDSAARLRCGAAAELLTPEVLGEVYRTPARVYLDESGVRRIYFD